MYWHGMIEGSFCQDHGRANLRVRRALPTWRGRSRALPCCLGGTDFTQGGEVGCIKWVKSGVLYETERAA